MLKLALATAVAIVSITAIAPANAQTRQTYNQGCTAGAACENSGTTYECGDNLGFLRRVYPAEVAGIDNSYRVWVTEVCTGSSLLRSSGNAAGLRNTIAKNGVLAAALQSKSFSANDVFAVRMMGEDTINLYVHNFQDYR